MTPAEQEAREIVRRWIDGLIPDRIQFEQSIAAALQCRDDELAYETLRANAYLNKIKALKAQHEVVQQEMRDFQNENHRLLMQQLKSGRLGDSSIADAANRTGQESCPHSISGYWVCPVCVTW